MRLETTSCARERKRRDVPNLAGVVGQAHEARRRHRDPTSLSEPEEDEPDGEAGRRRRSHHGKREDGHEGAERDGRVEDAEAVGDEARADAREEGDGVDDRELRGEARGDDESQYVVEESGEDRGERKKGRKKRDSRRRWRSGPDPSTRAQRARRRRAG